MCEIYEGGILSVILIGKKPAKNMRRQFYHSFLGFVMILLVHFIASTDGSDHQTNGQNRRNSNSSYDLFTCCSEVFGSCRTSCENLSLVQLAVVDSIDRDSKLGEIKRFCPSMQIEFWSCMNRTLQAVSRGLQWSGRRCCSHAISPRCQNTCATSSGKFELSYGCRQSDEQHLFQCFERQELADECCGNARASECMQVCREIFEQKSALTKEHRKHVEEVCGDTNSPNSKVLQCIRSFTDLTPIVNSKQYLPCCSFSSDPKCRETCKNVLELSETTQETIDSLEKGGCGPPLPHDPLWQCFLSAGRKVFVPSSIAEVSQINQIGMDSAKLHCCHKAMSPKCRRLCVQTYSNDWTSTRGDFEVDCLIQVTELDLRQCIEEVDEPCELGCDGLFFCTNFNNRPTELFRSCSIHADAAARSDVNMWQQSGSLALPGLDLPIRNISKCSPETWKAIACTLQIKPCTRSSHRNQICRADCYDILDQCMDWTRLPVGLTAASLCSKLSPDDELSCASLKPYLEPSDILVETGGHHQLSAPCKGHPCNATQVCMANRNESRGHLCAPGCPLGETSAYWVPFGAYVRIPVASTQTGCLKICRCGNNGKIEHCQPLPCFSYEGCNLAGRRIAHSSWFYLECNICSCYAGEITCTKKQCKIPGMRDQSYTSLPCNCPPHYVPVCGKNGYTYQSTCLAKCTGLLDAEIEFGACRSHNPCDKSDSCPAGMKCVQDRQVCLSARHRPCIQHKCVNASSAIICNDNEIACDTSGRIYKNVCHLLVSGAEFSHFGPCFHSCSRKGKVCGINGVTYNSECEAWSDFSLADYTGNCRQIGLLSNEAGNRCQSVKCTRQLDENCPKIVPPGACCAICSGAIRITISRKQIDRALYALSGKNTETVTLRSVLRALDRLVQISECQLSGFLTVETDLFVSIQPWAGSITTTPIQIEACNREAEKIATLIETQSHRITSNLALSALTVANIMQPSSENRATSQTLSSTGGFIYLIISIINLLYFKIF